MTRRDAATLGNGPIRRPRRLVPRCRRPDCDGQLVTKRDGDHVVTTCSNCGHDAKDRHAPKPKLDTEEPQLTRGLEKYEAISLLVPAPSLGCPAHIIAPAHPSC